MFERNKEEKKRRCDRALPPNERKLRAKQLSPPVVRIISHCFPVNTLAAKRADNRGFREFFRDPAHAPPPPPSTRNSAKTRRVIVFPICIDWIPRSSQTASFPAERKKCFCRCSVEVTSCVPRREFVPSDSQRNECRGISMRFGSMAADFPFFVRSFVENRLDRESVKSCIYFGSFSLRKE